MSTNVKPLQGRHRADRGTRSPLSSASLPLLLGAAAPLVLAMALLVGGWVS